MVQWESFLILHQRPYTTCCKYSGCTGLTTVISNILNPAEKGCPLSEEICSQATLIVPKGTKTAYHASGKWNMFANIVEASDGNTGGSIPTEATVSISSARQGTFCYDYDLDFSGVEGIKALKGYNLSE